MFATSRRFAGLITALAALALASSPARRAQAEPDAIAPEKLRAMTLEAAIAYARAHHPQLAAAEGRVAAARAEARVPAAQWYPTIGLLIEVVGATVNNSTATPLSNAAVDIPRIGATKVTAPPDVSFQPYPSTLAALGVRQTLFDFGRIAAQTAALDLLADAEKHRAIAVRLDVDHDVEQTYYAVLAARAVVSASEQAIERSKRHRDLARASVASQMRPPVDLTRAEADLARFELGKIRAEGGLRVARSIFAAAVGVPEPELDAIDGHPGAGDLPSIEASMQRAEQNDPALMEARARLAAQRAQSHAIMTQMRPNLFGTAMISGRGGGAPPNSGPSSPYGGWLPTIPNWSAGIVLSWPVFDASVLARRAASRAREDALSAEIAAARQRVTTLVQRAYREAEIAAKAMGALERAAQAARENYAQAEARYKAGLGSSVELSDAETLRTEAEIQLAIGVFQRARARAALDRATAGKKP